MSQQAGPADIATRLEVILSSTRGKTLFEHILQGQLGHPEATGDFSLLLNEIVVCGKIIASKMARAGIADVIGATGDSNVQGETVKVMDTVANDVIKRRLLTSGSVCILVSEEDDEPLYPAEGHDDGKYAVALDPLDGSSNIDCNVPVGTIFSIFRRKTPRGTRAAVGDVLQRGRDMVCGGYITYGPSVMLVLTWGAGVNGFTFDPMIGEFILSHPNITIPAQRSIYSVNEGNYYSWGEHEQAFVDWIKHPDKATKRPYSGRYVGSMVADVHRTLLYGGLFMYPPSNDAPKGKLRYLYEVAPMSFLMEQAGGAAVSGADTNVLDLVPTSIHQRSPVYLGSKNEIQLIQKFLRGERL
eukprot:TRINITY_DN4253_c0_g1_i1.p1 TRINITY_DN4253_c0_g1~~TRINITY_DN4253_c0_g1_i1.p1  ORF type:complete len:356 (+),score=83.00 TRINITY_DN4253_c0_g1_i1:89-1156(+)